MYFGQDYRFDKNTELLLPIDCTVSFQTSSISNLLCAPNVPRNDETVHRHLILCMSTVHHQPYAWRHGNLKIFSGEIVGLK
jgi:hypothetical protein